MRGDAASAIKIWSRESLWRVGQPNYIWLTIAYARSGQEAKAREAFASYRAKLRKPSDDPLGMALATAALGDRDEALAWLERAVEARSEDMVFLNVEPAWDPLRSDPRFRAILRRMGFEP
jgi:hypothetical protein